MEGTRDVLLPLNVNERNDNELCKELVFEIVSFDGGKLHTRTRARTS